MSTTGGLPNSVHELLSNSKFVHLATCSHNVPHVSLMNYTFIEPGEKEKFFASSQPLILVATPKNTKKFENLIENNKCSLLVHDWVTNNQSNDNSVLKLLKSINQNEVGELSCTLDGHVIKFLLNPKEEEYEYYKEYHLKNNPDARAFVDADDVALVLIKVDGSIN